MSLYHSLATTAVYTTPLVRSMDMCSSSAMNDGRHLWSSFSFCLTLHPPIISANGRHAALQGRGHSCVPTLANVCFSLARSIFRAPLYPGTSKAAHDPQWPQEFMRTWWSPSATVCFLGGWSKHGPRVPCCVKACPYATAQLSKNKT